jgi:hypothetical protein
MPEEVAMSVLKRICLFLLLSVATVVAQRGQPQVFPPTADERAQIDAKLADLRGRIDALAARKTDPQLLADVAVHQKAAQNILRFPEEFFTAKYAPNTIAVLDMGLARAKELEAGAPSWTKRTGHVVRGYVSRVDGSVQPYGLTIPASYDGTKPMRLDVWLHGTQLQLNEVDFINQQARDHDTSQIAAEDYIQLEPLGRMNLSYRWSGETDVFYAVASVEQRSSTRHFSRRSKPVRDTSIRTSTQALEQACRNPPSRPIWSPPSITTTHRTTR